MFSDRIFLGTLLFYLFILYYVGGQKEKPIGEENATIGKFLDTYHFPNVSEIWTEMHRLRTLINQETDLRLAFQQNFLVHLNTLQQLESSINRCGETRAKVQTNTKWLRNVEHRLNIVNSSFTAFLHSKERGCHSGKVRAHDYPEAPEWPVSQNISFYPPFEKTPALTYGVSFLDSEYDNNVRAVVTTHNISRYGFTLTLNTYANTSQWGLEASWMACPAR